MLVLPLVELKFHLLKSMVWSEEQPLNMLDILVTADVLSAGMVCRLEQPLNMLDIVVTALVSSAGMVCKLKQL